MTNATARRDKVSLLLNPLCAVTSVAWLIHLAITWTDNTVWIIAALAICLLCGYLTLMVALFLTSRRSRRAPRTSGSASLPAAEALLTPSQDVEQRTVASSLEAYDAASSASATNHQREESRQRRQVWLLVLAWFLLTLGLSHFLAAYLQARQRLWSGFVFSESYGWYPEKNMRDRHLMTPFGGYSASTDVFGHRNRLSYDRLPPQPVVLQGDSNTFGFGLAEPDTLAAQLNEHLTSAGKTPRVFNLGVPGFDLNQYYYQYEEFAPLFPGAIRIIHWNIGNDFPLSAVETPNYFRRPYVYVDDGDFLRAESFRAPLPVQGYGQTFVPSLAQWNRLIQSDANNWANVFPEWFLTLPLPRQMTRTYFPKWVKATQMFSQRSQALELYDPHWLLLKPPQWPAPYQRFAQDFPILMREIKRQNPKVVLVAYPFRQQIISAEQHAARKNLESRGHTADQFDPLAFNAYLRTVCAEAKVHLIDTTPLFLAEQEPLSLFQPEDQHLSPKGMRLCAQAIINAGILLKP